MGHIEEPKFGGKSSHKSLIAYYTIKTSIPMLDKHWENEIHGYYEHGCEAVIRIEEFFTFTHCN